MAYSIRFASLVDFYIKSLQAALKRTLVRDHERGAELVSMLQLTMTAGDRSTTSMMLEEIGRRSSTPIEHKQLLFAGIIDLALVTPVLLRGTPLSTDLKSAVDASHRIASVLVEIKNKEMAYNLFETAYHFSELLGQPSFAVAKELLKFSNPDNIEQHYSAIWRYAIARLRETVQTKDNWLEAVDAFELALSVPVRDAELQKQLCDQLTHVTRSAQGTPIEELVAILPIQVPASAIDPEIRSRVISKLAGASLQSNNSQALEFLAAVRGQNFVDDMRLRFSGESRSRPNLTWHDLTLNHSELTNAVPLGESLVVDVNRTGSLLMELIHEVGHAYSLIGPIGWARTALRVAVHYCELLIVASELQDSNANRTEIEAIAQLPIDSVAHVIAETQLASAFRSSVLQAVWTSWLEGVAIYLELLCDPKEDLQEISAVHEAVRSLIDYREHQRPEESQERYAERMGAESATHFENFCSEAIRRHSGLGHIGYIEPGKLRDINVAGYLLVRSMVGRWEKTLGRRLDPIRAVRLLLDATRNGTSEALPAVDVDVADFQNEANSLFQRWLVSLANLDYQTLECFFESVQPGVKGHQYYWREGKPWRVSDDLGAAQSVALGYLSKLQEMCIQLVMGVGAGKAITNKGFGHLMAAITEKDTATILNLLTDHLDILGLLPVGREMARLLFVGDAGRVVVCPRTYTGLTVKSGSESWPRYSIRSFVLQGGADEVSRLRGLCAKARSARVLTTRVLDLVGHPESPLKRPNMSYVCLLLGSSWHRITIGDSFVELDGEQNAFIEVIKKRLHPRPFFTNEAQTLASCNFLASRLQSAVPNSRIANLALSFIRLDCSRDVAFESLAQALATTDSTSIKKAFDNSMVEGKTRSNIAEYLYLTGRGQSTKRDHPALSCQLGQIAFTDKFSGIAPFLGG